MTLKATDKAETALQQRVEWPKTAHKEISQAVFARGEQTATDKWLSRLDDRAP